MKQILIAAAVSFVVAFCLSWWVHSKFDQADLVKQLKAQAVQADQAMTQRVAQERDAVKAAESKLLVAQQESRDLQAKLVGYQTAVDKLQEQINHATFNPPDRPSRPTGNDGAAGRCPGALVSSPEFLRLYDAAAQGHAADSAAGAAGAAGVPQGIVPGIR